MLSSRFLRLGLRQWLRNSRRQICSSGVAYSSSFLSKARTNIAHHPCSRCIAGLKVSPYPAISFSTDCSEAEYEKNAIRALTFLTEYLDRLPERIPCDDDYDVDYAMGVLTARISPKVGTYVINMQTPNRQLWLSSPISGPKRYDYVGSQWIYSHDGVSLDDLLTKELRQIFKSEEITIKIQ